MSDALQRAVVSILINDDDLDPHEITGLLGGNPHRAVRKGEMFTSDNRKKIAAKTGMWHFGVDWKNAPNVGDEIASLLGRLTQDLDVWKSVTSRFDCYVGVGGEFINWSGGLTLKPDVLMLMAERGLIIDFDLYAPAASDVEEMP